MDDGTVYVAWAECDCEWVTKFCDDNHMAYAQVPVVELEKWRVKR